MSEGEREQIDVSAAALAQAGANERIGPPWEGPKRAATALMSCAPFVDSGNPIRIGFDAGGMAVDGRSEPASAEFSECLEAALDGLAFPCLANFDICTQTTIGE